MRMSNLNGIRVLSLFDGISGCQTALKNLNIKVSEYFSSEIDKYAISITMKNFPNTIQLGDVTKVNKDMVKTPIKLMTWGSPCFVQGSLVLTEFGYKSIEEVQIGDYVLTHKNRFRQVLKIGGDSNKQIYSLNSMGSEEIETTEDHPFYVREMKRKWDNLEKKYIRDFSPPFWCKTKDLKDNYYLGTPLTTHADYQESQHSSDFWYFVGRFTADGWLHLRPRKDKKNNNFRYLVTLCCGKTEKEEVISIMNKLNYNYSIKECRTSYKFFIQNKNLFTYLEQIKRGAANKIVHPDIFYLEDSKIKAFLMGYFSGNGWFNNKNETYTASSVSKKLIYGVSYLINKVYKTPTRIYFNKVSPTKVIEGRLVNQRNYYSVRFKINPKPQDKAFFEANYVWFPIRSIEKTDKIENVFNIEVEEDNSYVVQNVTVHNCQDLSLAKKDRKGLDGERSGLFWEAVRIFKEIQPEFFTMENVASMSKKDKDIISETLGVEPVLINSALLSAQQRKRLYWVGKRNSDGTYSKVDISQPEDLKIYLKDIIETGDVDRLKPYCIDASYYKGTNLETYLRKAKRQIVFEGLDFLGGIESERKKWLDDGKELSRNYSQGNRVYSDKGKSATLSANGGGIGARTGLYLTEIEKQRDIKEQILAKKEGTLAHKKSWESTKSLNDKSKALTASGQNITNSGATNLVYTVAQRGRFINEEGKRQDFKGAPTKQRFEPRFDGKTNCLTTVQKDNYICEDDNKEFVIRKLTPTECERLQTFPDNYTSLGIDINGKEVKISNTQRYKALGNSFTVKVIEHILKEIFKNENTTSRC